MIEKYPKLGPSRDTNAKGVIIKDFIITPLPTPPLPPRDHTKSGIPA